MPSARVTAFGHSLIAERRARSLNRIRFAELCCVSVSALNQWEYGRRGITSATATKLARRLGLPAWHFEQALAQDRMASVCRAAEVTTVVVGLVQYVERRLPGARWADVRAKLLEGA